METNNENNAVVQFGAAVEAIEWTAKRDAALATAAQITAVSDALSLDAATACEKEMKSLRRKLETERKRVTEPLDAAKKELMRQEKELRKSLDFEIDRLDKLNADYAYRMAQEAEAERRRIEAEERARAEAALAAQEEAELKAQEANAANAAFGLDAAEPQAPTASVPPPAPTVIPTAQMAKAASAAFTEKWRFEVTDANAVPRELCSPDPAKVNAFLAAKKAEGYRPDQLTVAGLRIFATMQVRSR